MAVNLINSGRISFIPSEVGGNIAFIQTPVVEWIDYVKKFLFVYRNGSNSSTVETSYRITSGSSAGSEIDLYMNGAIYNHTMRDNHNRIWSAIGFRNAENNRFTSFYTYAYIPSCNSYKTGGCDYWFSPCGKCIGSGSATQDVGLTITHLQNCNCSPISSIDISFDYCHHMTVMPNGEFLFGRVSGTTSPWEMEFYYMSANQAPSGVWHMTHQEPYPSVSPGSWYDWAVTSTKSNVAIFHTSAGSLEMKVSSDNGRTWGDWQTIESMNQTAFQYKFMKQFTYYDNPTDEYARIILTKWSGSASDASLTNAKSGSSHIYKINTESPYDYVSVKTDVSGMNYTNYVQCFGEHKDGLNIATYPQGKGSTLGGDGNNPPGNPGDPRFLQYYNEDTGAFGSVHFDDSNGWLWGSHVGGAARFDKNGVIWATAAGYFGTEGSACYRGHCIPPDLCSGSTDPEGTYTEVIDNVDNTGGGCCSGIEILDVR